MFKILVPVDFYNTSFSAFQYALKFSELFPNSEITLLHVINGSFNTNELMISDFSTTRIDAALLRLTYFVEEYPKELGLAISDKACKKVVQFGLPGFTIAEYAKQNNFDIVIMGTRDKHSLFDKVLGSASMITVKTTKCPVMLIHEGVTFNTPQKIVFGFDTDSEIDGALAEFTKLNKVMKAYTDFVHVNENSMGKQTHLTEKINQVLFKEGEDDFLFKIKKIPGDNPLQGLREYCDEVSADILIITHKKEALFKSLFSKKHTIKIAQGFNLPVIVFHEGN